MNYRSNLAKGKEEKDYFRTLSKEVGNKMPCEIAKSRNDWNSDF